MNNKQTYRHGDWNFVTVNEIKGEKIELKEDKFTFAVGEASNHYHTAHADMTEMAWYKLPDGSYTVKVDTDMRLTHPEHSLTKDLIVKPGIYKVYQRREKDWLSMETRKVKD